MRINLLFIILSTFLYGCINSDKASPTTDEGLTVNQQKMLDEGWISADTDIKSKDISSEYGITPIYGILDNYFDVKMGTGSDLVLKIIDLSKNKCIRYIYVKENSEFTISQIPQGKYQLLLAYGKNWMTKKDDNGGCIGKFSNNVHYEKSTDIFDFGKKNSRDMINYSLEINVKWDGQKMNFNTEDISEEEFYSVN